MMSHNCLLIIEAQPGRLATKDTSCLGIFVLPKPTENHLSVQLRVLFTPYTSVNILLNLVQNKTQLLPKSHCVSFKLHAILST